MSHRTIMTIGREASGVRTLAYFNRMGSRCVLAFRKWRKAQRSRRVLSSFDDRLLADLGLTRHQIGLAEHTDKFPRNPL